MRTIGLGFAAGLVAVCVALPVLADVDKGKLDRKVEDAKSVYQELLATPDRGVPETLLKDCKCIAVVPHVLKGAIGYGARFGQGVMSCRTASGWSPPTFVTIRGGSVGFQLGAESTDMVLFFTTERGARSLLTGSQVTLGGKISVAAGPVGRSGEASTDLKLNAEIYSYAESKGLFAGLSVEGARMAADKKANAVYYGAPVTVENLLFKGESPELPETAKAFLGVLP